MTTLCQASIIAVATRMNDKKTRQAGMVEVVEKPVDVCLLKILLELDT